ncbi:5'/3'-nucleotidase SurE [Aquamicrobium segne]|uniref:5'-nucleotidase SurE n=1 Tax=Aquamicrobium segne TaxID=469547 RepID=A0ABW0GWT1_9HYPH
MRILITNDDGIHAEGLESLVRIAHTLSDDVWVVAPETDQSGYAHSLSISEPLRLRKVSEKRFAVRGTPTDCVIMGVRKVLPDLPDLVLSGINSGSNIADDVTYSGTVAGAMEGTLLGIRSIALSQTYKREGDDRAVPYETAEALAPALLQKILAMPQQEGVLININFPACAAQDVKGTQVTAQGKVVHRLWIDERRDGRGLPYYWMRFGRNESNGKAGTDIHAIENDFVSVTPLKLDFTAHEVRDQLAKVLA